MICLQGQNRPRKRGVALILAIFTCVILTVLAVGIAGLVRVELLASRGSYDRMQARYLAQAGFNLARSVLMYAEDETPRGDDLQDPWAKLSEEPSLELGEGSCRVIIVDACSRINVNTADERLLTGIFKDPALAQAIISWRDANGSFKGLGDLLRVEGMDAEKLLPVAQWLTVASWEPNVYYEGETEKSRVNLNGSDRNELQSQLQTRLRLTSAEAGNVLKLRDLQPEQKFISPGQLSLELEEKAVLSREKVINLLDKVSLTEGKYWDGRLNLNTAPKEILEVLPGVTPEFVEAVLARRESADPPREPFRSPRGVWPLLEDITDEDFITLSRLFCIKSASFIIEADGRLADRPAHCTLQGLVVRHPGPTAPLQAAFRELTTPMFLTGNATE